jgi:glycosyltransferase involved in cell wall biosynthesis
MSRVDSPRRKIAYMLTPIDFGGAERVSLNLLKSIDRDVFDLCPIILVRPWENRNIFIDEIKKENYQYIRIPVAIKPLSEGKDYFRIIRCFRMLFSILRKERYDLVHTNGYFADIVGIPVSRLLGIPHIATCHGFISNDRNLRIYNTFDIMALRFARKIIAVSEEIKRGLIRSGVRKSRVLLIQNAVELTMNNEIFFQNRERTRKAYGINKKEIVLGYIGRLSEEKGLKYLIQAGSKLTHTGLPLKIMIIGSGPQKPEMESLVQQMSLQNKVVFSGFQKYVEKILPAMDIFVLPSLTEGTPMALLEAMACGVPVVASAVGEIPNIIDSGKNGILIPPANPEKIAEAVLTICRNNDFRTKLSETAKETIRSKFNINEWMRKIESVYLEIISSQETQVRN